MQAIGQIWSRICYQGPLLNVPYLEHPLGKTHYTVKGKASKRTPIIWLHGGPGGTHNPSSALFSLADDRKVYAYTQLGSGKSSDLPKRRWRISTFVNELSYLIDAWQLEHFHLMGGSWGTTLAVESFIKREGKGIRSLVLQSPMLCAEDWQKDAKRLIRKLPTETRRVIHHCEAVGATDSGVYQTALRTYYGRHVLRRPKKLAAMLARNNPRGAAIYNHMWGASEFSATGTLRDYDRTGALPDINVPTLILCGEHDEATPQTGKRYSRLFEDGQFEKITGGSHALWEEKPAKMRARIQRFIRPLD